MQTHWYLFRKLLCSQKQHYSQLSTSIIKNHQFFPILCANLLLKVWVQAGRRAGDFYWSILRTPVRGRWGVYSVAGAADAWFIRTAKLKIRHANVIPLTQVKRNKWKLTNCQYLLFDINKQTPFVSKEYRSISLQKWPPWKSEMCWCYFLKSVSIPYLQATIRIRHNFHFQ